MTTQTQQMEAFPRTTLELLEELAEVHRADQDKAVKALDALSDDEKIARAYEKAEDRLAKARHLVAAIDQAAERERKRLTTPDVAHFRRHGSVMQEAADIVNSGVLDTDGLTITASVSPDVRNLLLDPITGEVAPAVVFALYPGDDEPHETPVGDRTRYSELVADYFTEAGLNAKVDADEWTVVARRELMQDGGGHRSLHDVIAPADYGQELLVIAADQGSVTGANELLEDAVR